MQHVVEWQEQRAIPFQGYYRLILPPVVKKLQAGIKAYYRDPNVIMYSSAGIALKELLDYLWIEEGTRSISFGSSGDKAALGDVVERSAFDVKQGSGELFLTTSTTCEGKPASVACSILVLESMPESREICEGWDFVVMGVAKPDSPVNAAVILTRREDQAKVIHERNRRRGACIAARDGAWLLGRDTDLVVRAGVKEQVVQRLCELEGAKFGTLYPSGMCAVTMAMEVARQSGKSRFIVVGHPYSDTHLLCKDMPWAGEPMTSEMLRGSDLAGLETALQTDTAAVIVESISNPLNEVPDLERISEICRAHGVLMIVDSTMASPYNCQPLNLGADLVVHSTAKYLSGKNNHGGGAILTNNPAAYATLIAMRDTWQVDMSALEADVLWQSIQDFEARMEVFNRNGLAVAEWLQTHPAVEKVYFAMLPDNPDRAVAERLLRGGGSVVSFSLKNRSFETAKAFYDTSMPLIKKAPSLGSNITLMCPYTLLTYYQKDDAYLENYRLDRYLVRISVGCEDPITPVLENLDTALSATVSS
jgi:cystathionine beta-lyase/cystathionine gamma-synthase